MTLVDPILGGQGVFGGDLAYVSDVTQMVVGLRGRSLNVGAPTNGQCLVWDAASNSIKWVTLSLTVSLPAGGANPSVLAWDGLAYGWEEDPVVTSLTTSGAIVAGGNISTATGNIAATAGLVSGAGVASTGTMSATEDITAGTFVYAGTYMHAVSYMEAGTYVAAGTFVSAGTYVGATDYVAVGNTLLPSAGGVRLNAAHASVYGMDSGGSNLILVRVNSDKASLGDTSHDAEIVGPDVRLYTSTDQILVTAESTHVLEAITPKLVEAASTVYTQHQLFEWHHVSSATTDINFDLDTTLYGLAPCSTIGIKWRVLVFEGNGASWCGEFEAAAAFTLFDVGVYVLERSQHPNAAGDHPSWNRFVLASTYLPVNVSSVTADHTLRLTVTPKTAYSTKWVVIADVLGIY